MVRPPHLPDYTNPPLDEVVLGVQFSPVQNFSSVFLGEVRDLFLEKFPKAEEHPTIDSSFEAFGGRNPEPSFEFQIGPPRVGSRLWFLTEDENSLLQFQSDRFLANWRKKPRPQDYPRFEGIAESFESNFETLADYLLKRFNYVVDVNQAEVAYINIIPVSDFADASRWFKLWGGGQQPIETLNVSFDEVVEDKNGKPVARMKHRIQSVFAVDGSHRAFRFSITFKGKPDDSTIRGAMDFVKAGRERIVTRFAEITTQEAQEYWGKIG